MSEIINWPFNAFLSFCGTVISWFVDKGSINFILLQIAVALLLIAFTVILITYWRRIVVFLKSRLHTGASR